MADTFAAAMPPRHARVSESFQSLRYQVGKLFFATPVYGLTLGTRVPEALSIIPPDPWPGSADRGSMILRDRFTFGNTLDAASPKWAFLDFAADDFADLHGFDWLRDLRAVGGDTPRRRARSLVKNWIDTYSNWDPDVWRPDILGTRISSWLGQYGFFCASADDTYRGHYLDSLARQARHLSRALPGDTDGERLFVAIKGLILAGLALPGHDNWLSQGLKLLNRQIRRQFLPDGGHLSRCPATHAQVIRHLVDIRSALLAATAELPPSLINAIDRAAPFLRMLRHSDGSLAMFNGGPGTPGWLLDMLLAQADARGRPTARAPHSGYERISANRTLVMVDVGPPAPSGLDKTAHAGTLSFELSVGKERIIVNCGHHSAPGPWELASRATAANSTLVVDNTNSTQISETGGLGRRPRHVEVKRNESDGASWIEGRHDGYGPPFGLTHKRRLYVSADGEDIRGQDALERTGEGAEATNFAVRFHLHPTVRPTFVANGTCALLQLASGSRWQLRATGGQMALEESVYLSGPGQMERTHQIVISGPIEPHEKRPVTIKWAIQRVPNAA